MTDNNLVATLGTVGMLCMLCFTLHCTTQCTARNNINQKTASVRYAACEKACASVGVNTVSEYHCSCR